MQEEEVTQLIKKDIVEGHLLPGARFANRKEMARQYGCCLATLQRAVDCLASEGFLQVGARKKGTHVAENPPHLSNYLVFFPKPLRECGKFWQILFQMIHLRQRERRETFTFFHGIRNPNDFKVCEAMIEDVSADRVAGILFASEAREFMRTSIYDKPGIPRVAIGEPYELLDIPRVGVAYQSFFERAVNLLVGRGRKKIAAVLVSGGQDKGGMSGQLYDAMRAQGLEINPLWVQYAKPMKQVDIRQILHLMFNPGQPDCPDALILLDDNNLAGAEEGLRRARITPGKEVEVVALANFPLQEERAYPFFRLGFDVPDLLEQLFWLLRMQKAGKKVPMMTWQQAILQGE